MGRKRTATTATKPPMFDQAAADDFAEQLAAQLSDAYIVAVMQLPTLKEGPQPFIRVIYMGDGSRAPRCVLTIFRPTLVERAAFEARSRAGGRQ